MISIIVCSVDPAKFSALTSTVATAMSAARHEIVGIHDAKSLCEGYNRGVALARGEICVFAHDDIELLSTGLAATLERHLGDRDLVGVAGTTRLADMGWASSGILHARGMIAHVVGGDFDVRFFGMPAGESERIEALDGVFFVTRREVAQRIGFDADTFDGWHGYDTDFTYRCHLAGLRVGVALDIPMIHTSDGNVDASWLEFDRRFRVKHKARLTGTPGLWLNVHRRVRARTDIRAAYDLSRLRTLTAEVARRVAAHDPAGAA